MRGYMKGRARVISDIKLLVSYRDSWLERGKREALIYLHLSNLINSMRAFRYNILLLKAAFVGNYINLIK